MQDHRNAGAPPEPGTPEHRMQRVLLLELLTDAPPEAEALTALAARLREPVEPVASAAAALAAAGLAELARGRLAAAAPARYFDVLWPIAL